MRRPEPNEAAEYYAGYINLVPGDNVVNVLEKQANETEEFLKQISEDQSLRAYQQGKWTIREVLSHVNDGERVFLSRAFWFARGFTDSLPSYDQDVGATHSGANDVSWNAHVQEFHNIRLGTLSFFKNMPDNAWSKTGVASGNPFTVRALAYIIAGHVFHHVNVIRERYLATPKT